jgi:hypothetical protein
LISSIGYQSYTCFTSPKPSALKRIYSVMN